MTLVTTAARVQYTSPGVGPFTIPFRFTTATDLQVIKRDSAGVETTLTLTTHFTVAGAGDSTSSLTLVTALVSGETLSIVRAPTFDQQVSLANQLSFYGSTHEAEFDRLVMQMQLLEDAVDRSFKLKKSYDPNGITTDILPRANQIIGFNAAGDALTSYPASTFGSTATAILSGFTNVKAAPFNATGDGITNEQTALTAAIASAANTLYFPPGTYLVDGLTASVANQRWYLDLGATIKLKNAGNAAVITVTAAGVRIEGPGTIDGNRANQSASGDSVSYAGIKSDNVTGLVVDGPRITNCKDPGIVADRLTTHIYRRLALDGNGAAANLSQFYVKSTGNSVGLIIDDCDVDGTVSANGGFKINATGGFTLTGVYLTNLRIKPGDGVAAYDVIGLELFANTSGTIENGYIGNISIEGPNITNTRIFGFSMGGDGTTSATGIRGIAVGTISVRKCRKIAVEIIARECTFASITTRDSGNVTIVGDNQVGGIRGISIAALTVADCVDTAYAVRIEARANSIDGLTIGSLNILRSVGPGLIFYVSSTGAIRNVRIGIGAILGVGGTGVGFAVVPSLSGGTIEDIDLGDLTIDGTGMPANTDGVLFNGNASTFQRIRANRMKILNATRHGWFHNAATTDISLRNSTISGNGLDGFRSSAGDVRTVIENNTFDSNGGTGVILTGSPDVRSLKNNMARANTTAQFNLGTAVIASRRGNQYSVGASDGVAVLVGGTVTVNTAEVQAGDRIQLTRTVTGGAVGHLTVGAIVAGTSLVITSSSGTDTSTIFWEIVH
jgi:hypothetical protein